MGSTLFRRLLRLALALFAVSFATHAQTTTFTGTVYSPRGVGAGDPLPNILVFVEDPNHPAPKFTPGIAVPNAGCSAQPVLTPDVVLGNGSTQPDGTYAFSVAGALPDPVNLYIQAGKWRTKTAIPLASIKLGVTNTFNLAMPAQAGAGTNAYGPTTSDFPNIAIVTGTGDALECLLPQIGISPGEVTDPNGTGHINLFWGSISGGQVVSNNTPTEDQLFNPSVSGHVPLTNYDVVMLACQDGSLGRGEGDDGTADQNAYSFADTLTPYANAGGRIFAGHWEYVWLQSNATWGNIASYDYSKAQPSSGKLVGIATGQLWTGANAYSGEPTLSQWMTAIKAFNVNASKLQFTLTNVFENIGSVNSPGQIWATLPDVKNRTAQFSFDTPVTGVGSPTASLAFTNTTNVPNEFLVGDPDDVVTVTATNTSSVSTTAGLTLSLTIPSVLHVASIGSAGGAPWTCTQASNGGICTLAAPIAPGASAAVDVHFSISKGTSPGIFSLTALLSGGGLNQSTQCGRALYNDFHVEGSLGRGILWNNAAHCDLGDTLSPAQRFLEYSLYNLSNTIAPANADTIVIQAPSTISWTPLSPVYYGTTIAQIENGTVNTPGTSIWTISPSATDLLDPGTYQFTLNFTPTDTRDYGPSTSTHPVTVLIDPTVASIGNLSTSIFYGQEIGYTNGLSASLNVAVQPGLPNLVTYPTVKGGAETLTLDGATVCTGIAGQPLTSGTRPGACPDAGFVNLLAGPHTLHLSYSGTIDFLPSDYTTTVLINADPTTTTLRSTGNGTSNFGDNITYTGSVADAYATAAGTITFYDSPVSAAVGSTPPPGSIALRSFPIPGAATFSVANLAAGTHYILACFSAPLNSAGYLNFAPSCSPSTPQVVNPVPVTPEGTVITLISSANPSPFGNAVTFTAAVQTTGAISLAPAGTVTFLDNGKSIGTGTLDANGAATFTTTTLSIGTHPITAKYPGSASQQLASSTSATRNELIVSGNVATDTGFLLRINPVVVPIFVGSTATATVQIVPLTNFNEPVKLTCTGLPAQSACTFAQFTVPAGGGSTTLILSSGAPHDCGSSSAYFAGFGGRGTLALLSLSTLTLCLARRRRKLQTIALTVLLLTLPNILAGCGDHCTDFGVKPGDYTFKVSATSTGATATTHTQDMVMRVTLQ